MGNFCVQPRCCSCTSCCSTVISAKTLSLTIAGMAAVSGATCNCNLLNTTYVFGTPIVTVPYQTGGRKFCLCYWNCPFAWACTSAGSQITSAVAVCLMYNGTASTIVNYSCTGLDSFGSGLPSGHTRIGINLRGSYQPDTALWFQSWWLLEYPNQIDCSIINNLSIPFYEDPFVIGRKCAGTSATAVLNLV